MNTSKTTGGAHASLVASSRQVTQDLYMLSWITRRKRDEYHETSWMIFQSSSYGKANPLFVFFYAAFALALPNPNPSDTSLSPRDDGWSHGVPARGVTCNTFTEKSHILSADAITHTMSTGAGNYFMASEYSSRGIYYPKRFPLTAIGINNNGHLYTTNWATGCDTSKTLLYMPIGYQGFNVPKSTGSTEVAFPPRPQSPISSDIVVFTTETPEQLMRSQIKAHFCAVLTNSDAQPSEALYTADGRQNPSPGGYHQCNANGGDWERNFVAPRD
ncbi:hypothetical protein ACLMJK_009109 [Lecanora helva]